jgi:DNA repair protein RecN (Recombination protein N)
MLLKLSVQNYILIQNLEIDFTDGFSVITGETGAGKSILLGALSLILGQRADSGILLDPSKKCVIEGLFRVNGYHLEGFFEGSELDFDDTIIMRREIGQNGKSRAFINDTPVNLTLLKDLGDRLVNVHSQHSITTLNDADFQLAVIDSFSGIQADVAVFRNSFRQFQEQKRQLAALEAQEAKAAGERDYFQFLFEELSLANPIPGELELITEELGVLNHAEEIRTSLYKAIQYLASGEENILTQLSDTRHLLDGIAKYKPELESLAQRTNSNYIDIKDIANELQALEERILVDPARVELLTQRHDLLFRLMKKHQVSTEEDLISLKREIGERLSVEAGLEDQITGLRKTIAAAGNDLLRNAKVLSAGRKKSLPEFEKEVTSLLGKLGIPTARFQVELSEPEPMTREGIDRVKFMFTANKGIELRDLAHTASGGELSRIMLAIKSMISQKNLLPTIIFDEIDNGVSGDIAGKVGTILKRMGARMQVIAITHLPQIAAKGDRHYWVYKSEDKQITTTFIRLLSGDERVAEIAKMLSSEVVTSSAINTANELLNN